MTVASANDVEARLGRALSVEERAQAEAYLQDAESRLLSRKPDLVEAAAADEVFRDQVVSVECAVAIRASRLAEGMSGAQPVDGSIAYSPTATAGYVAVRASEWRQLGLSRGLLWR